MRFRWEYFISGILMFLLCAAVPGSRLDAATSGEILVSAAMSLKDACEEMGSVFERETGIRVRFNLGASGLLQRQIETGAPVDIFASAGERQMNDLQSQGLIFRETRKDFAHNTLVLITPAHSPISIRSLQDLTRPAVSRIAIGNPRTVPAGQYAAEALRSLRLWDKVQNRLVLAENVRQVLEYVMRGEVDAGFVYASDMIEVHGKAVVAVQVPNGSYSPIRYPIAVVKGTSERTGAQRFIDLVLSSRGQAILKKYGFLGSR
jgi:molybdate transport system substrate-binding protein